ncbi:MAG: carboxypeptidase-like regulatory domain-containing protein [Candidatus Marinimicrobia bacterium]|nr:carboxypeptidase-like regulatory domain-containing protein [Candidatus Neomarinimicrobiota bacterium]MCF7904303.1 carboxypeptidase-like regulatory domain-containing protein [Candidatus Neomarinimicrobiota bacterium]
MKNKKLTLIALSLLLGLQVSFAQINSISGTIRNATTLEPLPYANLVIKGTYLGGTSNIDGYFYLSGLDDDSVQIVCSYMGYITFTTILKYEGESHIIIPIAMQPKTLGGEEVVVVDTELITPEVKVTSQIPAPQVATDIELKSSEGLEAEVYTYTLSAPIRWLYPTADFSHYILDGVPVEDSRHLYNVYPTFNLDAVTHIEQHPAGNIKQTSVEQTNSIELIYREGNRNETDVQAILGLVESGLTTSGPHSGGGSWYFSGRRVDFDAIYSLNTSQADSVYRRFRPDYYFYDLNGKVTFDVSNNTKVSGNGYLTFDKLHWLGNRGRSAHSSWYNGFISSRIQHRFSPRLTSQTNLYRKTFHGFLRADDIPEGLDQALNGDFVNQLTTLGLSSQADYFLGGNNMVTLSLSAERLGSELTYVDSSSSGVENGWITKAKAGYRYTLPYNIATDLGFQFVHSTFADNARLNPAILVSWVPSNIYNAHFSLIQTSHLVRETSLSNSLGMALFDMLVPVDNTHEIPEVMSIGLGGRFMPVVGYDFSAEVFVNKLKYVAIMDSSWGGDFSAQDQWLMKYDDGSVSGIELSVEKLTPGIRSKLSYRFSKANVTDTQGTEINMPGHRDHELHLIVDGKYKELTGYRLDFALASGKHYLKDNTTWDRSSPYHRIDLSFYRDVAWEKVDGRISLRLINITNATRGEGEYSDASWVVNTLKDRTFDLLPFTPTLNVEFLF